jgi:hypothetical protein
MAAFAEREETLEARSGCTCGISGRRSWGLAGGQVGADAGVGIWQPADDTTANAWPFGFLSDKPQFSLVDLLSISPVVTRRRGDPSQTLR